MTDAAVFNDSAMECNRGTFTTGAQTAGPHSTDTCSAEASTDSVCDTMEDSLGLLLQSQLLKGPKRRASFPSMRSEIIDQQHAAELQQVIHCMDSELERTAETINALSEDLETVATHHNWMQLTLENALESQAVRHQFMEEAHASRLSSDYTRSSDLTDTTAVYQEDFAADFDGWEEDMAFWRGEQVLRDASTTPQGRMITVATNSGIYGNTCDVDDEASLQDQTLSSFDDSDNGFYSDTDDFYKHGLGTRQWNSGSSYTHTDVSSRTSASSDRTLETHSEAYPGFGYDDEGVLMEKMNAATIYLRHRHDGIQRHNDNETTPAFGGRWRHRSRMPAAWPTTAVCITDTNNCNEDEFADKSQDIAIIVNLSSTVVCLSSLLFWTTVFVLATLTAVPSMVTKSRSKAMKCMEDAQTRLAGSLQAEEADPAETSMTNVHLIEDRIMSKSRDELYRHGQHTDHNGRLRSRQRLGPRRRQRDRMADSKFSAYGATAAQIPV